MMRNLYIVFLVLVLAGCGYHFSGQGSSLPGGVKRVYLPLFVNRTAEPQLESLVSNALSEALARNGNIVQVEDRQQAEAVLEGTVTSYTSQAVAYDKNDDISEYRSTMSIEVSLRQITDGRLLWRGQASWNEDYLADSDKARQQDLERDAIDEISRRISDEILSRMLDNF